MQNVQHLLIIEDDISLAEWIQEYLTIHHFKVSIINRGGLAVEAIKRLKPDLVVLDIELPEKNGFDICKEARHFYRCPILMITASCDEMDEVLSLELGADDYLSKPLRPRAMLARIQALLRRQVSPPPVDTLKLNTLTLNNVTKTAHHNSTPINLTSKEFELLWILADHKDSLVCRTDLIGQLRGLEYDGFDRSIDIRISRLRKK
ncbi:MAG TPA: response regulator transcription factor, partial [Marinagarivorans sp.]